jgi:hypothetical protein
MIKLADDIHIHMSKEMIASFPLQNVQQTLTLKPEGFWYTTGDKWINWCKHNHPNWVGNYIYSVYIENVNLLRIKTHSELIEFTEKYRLPNKSAKFSLFSSDEDKWKNKILMRFINEIDQIDYIETIDNTLIDWKKIETLYDGIEISPYQDKARYQYMWYYGWDIESGCIWNTKDVKFKLLTDKGIQ